MIPELCTAGKDILQKIGHILQEFRRRRHLYPSAAWGCGRFPLDSSPAERRFLSGIESANHGQPATNFRLSTRIAPRIASALAFEWFEAATIH
jgi:hypothetical protein